MNASFHPLGDEPVEALRLPRLYHIVYCSRAAPGVDDAAVARIVASSRRHNPVRGITGLLVFGSGVFFQWLEGPRDSVRQLMATLRTDPRHEAIVPLNESEEVRERLFPDWDMELVGAEHIREVLRDALDTATDASNVEALQAMLRQLDAPPPGDTGRG